MRPVRTASGRPPPPPKSRRLRSTFPFRLSFSNAHRALPPFSALTAFGGKRVGGRERFRVRENTERNRRGPARFDLAATLAGKGSARGATKVEFGCTFLIEGVRFG